MQAFSSHDIFQTLYQQIMLLELKPGSTLRENALCEQFGVSRTPVRSVLQELRIAGLIEVTPYKSTRVTQLDFDTISQQIYLRNAVESAVMTDFAAACTPEQLAQLKAALAQPGERWEHIGVYNVAVRLRLLDKRGRLVIRSHPGRGTAISMYLPLVELLEEDLDDDTPVDRG